MLRSVEFGKKYRISKVVKNDAVGMVSFQYPFKPPVDASEDGEAIATSANTDGNINTSGTSWTVRLPAKSRDRNSNLGSHEIQISSATTKRKKDKDSDLGEEDHDNISEGAHLNEVFVGESAPSRNEYLLTLSTDHENMQDHFTIDKVISIARLKHVTATLNEEVGKKTSIGSKKKRVRTSS